MHRLGAVTASLVAGACFSKPTQPLVDGHTDAAICTAALDIDGLVMYLPLNEATGVLASDQSPLHHDGAALGEPVWEAGKLGNGLLLDGVDDRIELGSPTTLDDLGAMSVCAWVRPLVAPPSNSATVADKSTDGGTGGWNMYLPPQGGGLRLGFFTNFRHYIEGQGVIPFGEWTHVCTTWDGTSGVAGVALYRNSQTESIELSDISYTGPVDSDAENTLVIGRQSNNVNYLLDGDIDEVMLFDKVLAPTEVVTIYGCAD